MATFDVSHPDVENFITCKREPGRLRKFNLSLLITEGLVDAVEKDEDWPLYFPIGQDHYPRVDAGSIVYRDWPIQDEKYIYDSQGRVACEVVKTVKATELWDQIMRSTYDYSDPGFLLIDHINRMNNNWFCETISSTNPCVTANTRLATQNGMVRVGDLYDSGADIDVTVDNRCLGQDRLGVTTRPAVPVFKTADNADVYRVTTAAGYEIEATPWHDFYTQRGKIQLKDLQPNDEIFIQSGKGQFGQAGSYNLGQLLGWITGDGHFTNRGNGEDAAVVNLWNEDRVLADNIVAYINSVIEPYRHLHRFGRAYTVSPVAVPSRNMVSIRSNILARALAWHGFNKNTKLEVPEVVWQGSEDCVKGYISALFQADGSVNLSRQHNGSCSIRLSSSHRPLLQDVQQLLANFGVFSTIHFKRDAGYYDLPNGHGELAEYYCQAQYELRIEGNSRETFMREIGFQLDNKNDVYWAWAENRVLNKTEKFSSPITEIVHIGRQAVYDTTQPDHNAVIFNGMVTGQCGEQPLPPNGACLLGSVNLAYFVNDPFTNYASFDWGKYKEVVRVFTRMLDNVVEINNLPLKEQREEIERKRRHGMGYLGLGSALSLLGIRYGSAQAQAFTEEATKVMAMEGWYVGLELAKEKGPAPIMEEDFTVTAKMIRQRPELSHDGIIEGDVVKGKVLWALYSRYMQCINDEAPQLIKDLTEHGCRFTHHTSIAPTGTIAMGIGNNVSNGIEPTFGHSYFRNVIRPGRKTKEQMEVQSFELLAYRHFVATEQDAEVKKHQAEANRLTGFLKTATDKSEIQQMLSDKEHHMAEANRVSQEIIASMPETCVTAMDLTPEEHVMMQAAAQKWVDSSISKTVNVPTDIPYEDFKDLYMLGYRNGLKGLTTFRYNPSVHGAVLVSQEDLAGTSYRFKTDTGEDVTVAGNEKVFYDGEEHVAANLFDAFNNGQYGKF